MAKTESKKGEATGAPQKPGSGGRRIDTNMLVILVAIAAIAVIVVFLIPPSSPPAAAVPPQQCGEQTLFYVNQLLARQGTVATLESVGERDGMYQVNISRKGGLVPLYVTRDCTLLFSQEGWEMGPPMSAPTASACGERTTGFINDYLVSEGTTGTLENVAEQHGMFLVNVSYMGEVIPLYATLDCSLLFNIFGDGLDITAPPPTPTPTPEPVKTDRPSVDLYVMSFCPYGTQAEATMQPVADLLGKKADIHLRYITSVTGTGISSVQSLHGAVEAEEDLRQICVQKYAPDSIWRYLSRFNAECYPLERNLTAMAACSRNITTSLGIDHTRITACVTGSEGIELLKTDEELSARYDATASPTLIINGVVYQGGRTPEAYKQAICGSITNPPPECATVLTSQQATATGSC